jgi:HK97 family phage major capsid protein
MAEVEGIVKTAERQSRNLTDDEANRFNATMKTIDGIDEHMAQVEAQEVRTNAAGAAWLGTVGPNAGRNSSVYTPEGRNSYIKDLIARTMPGRVPTDGGEAERLARHALEVRVNPNTTDGTGGEFVPPLWLMSEYIKLARAGRVSADLSTKLALPPGTDSINLPKVNTGSAVAVQTANAAAVASQDITTTSVSAGVQTIAGQQDLSIQLIEQSPAGMDQIVFADLLADYASKLDQQVLSGSGVNGQAQGVLGQSGIISVSYTDGTPTVAELFPKLADAIQQVATLRFLPPTAMIMHPRRWLWCLSALDSTSRPFVVPNASVGPFNALGVGSDMAAQGPVGSMLGLPVFLDPNVPINLGAGSNEDRIIIARTEDWYLFEGQPKMRVLPEIFSGTLQVRLQVYGYVAFTPGRYPKATAVISGTGLVTPTF